MNTSIPSRLLTLLLTAGLGGAFATTYYVSTTGSDGNPGTSLAQPWATLQHAVDTIAAGDTILVESGTYVGCRIGTSGASSAAKTLKADAGASVLVNAQGPANRHTSNIEVENFSSRVSYWVIDGFEVSNSLKYGIDIRNSDFITVQNNHVHNSTATGIFTAFANNALVQNNESNNNGEHGVYISNTCSNPTVRANRLHHNSSAGVHMNGDKSQGGAGVITAATVEKNVIFENGTAGASGINCDGVLSSIFRNNLLYNNHASGISLYAIDGAQGSSHNKVYNNTIVMASGSRWVINIPKSPKGRSNPVGNLIENNILYTPVSNHGSVLIYGSAVSGFLSDYNVVVNVFSVNGGTSNITLAKWQSFGYDKHSLIATPAQLFANPATNDYHLSATSPALNAGTFLNPDVTDDLEGTPRPQGGAYDIGCYEAH